MTGGLEVLYRGTGAPTQRPPLLFVHGAGHGAWCWDIHWMKEAARLGWECHALSLRGHGQSFGKNLRHRWTLVDYEKDVIAVAKSLSRKPVLIGHSMGGTLVQRCIARSGAMAGVLLATAGTRGIWPVVARIAHRWPRQGLRLMSGQHVSAQVLRDALFSNDLPEIDCRRYLARMEVESLPAILQLMVPARSPKSTKPMLVVGAAEDALIPRRMIRQTAARYGVKEIFLPRTAHNLMLDTRWRLGLNVVLDWVATL